LIGAASASANVSTPFTQHHQKEQSMSSINRVILTGNLTQDPELRPLPSGASVCKLRVASSTRRKSSDGSGYEDRPNYFNVTVWGAQGESAAEHLVKGRPVAIDGRLEWREWDTPDGARRQAVDIVADSVQFLGSPTTPEDGQLAIHAQQAPSRRSPRRAAPRRSYAHA
jgi:single-strand DNA-binding protein